MKIIRIIEYILVVVMAVIICLLIPDLFRGGNNDPRYLYSQTPEFKRVHARFANCSYVNNGIQTYHYYNKKYPNDLNDLMKTGLKPFLLDPLTNRSDWEVRDSKNPDKWHRTAIEPYDPVLPLWNPNEHDGIYEIRPPKHPEEEEVLKRIKSMRLNEDGIFPEQAEWLRQERVKQKQNNK